jgi:hypothetical protein
MVDMSTLRVETEARRQLLAAAAIDPDIEQRRWEPLSPNAQAVLDEWDRSGGLTEALNRVAASDPELRS